MIWSKHNSNEACSQCSRDVQAGDCAAVRAGFSAYLDGAISGMEMAAISGHLQRCSECAADFDVWREVQRSLGALGPKQAPARLQARLRAAVAAERERGAHLPLLRRALLVWKSSLAPLALRFSGGLTATVILAGGLCTVFGAPITVQANDDGMIHMVAPHYMYSQVPPDPIDTQRDIAIVVEAMVDSSGRVYSYSILEGPQDPQVKIRVENNLLSSVFTPATVFGVPVRGHVVMTYTGISVKG
jgi:hypothetical protein